MTLVPELSAALRLGDNLEHVIFYSAFFYFDIEQSLRDVMSPFSWWTDTVGNDLHMSAMRNMDRVGVDFDAAGLDKLSTYRVLLQAEDFDTRITASKVLAWPPGAR